MCEAVNNILCHGTVQLFRPATPHCILRLAQRPVHLLLLCSEVILSKRFIVNSRCHQQCGLPYTMYKAASNVVLSFQNPVKGFGKGERISADYCHQKTTAGESKVNSQLEWLSRLDSWKACPQT